jgi:AcrR family transcriptional regulator
VTTAIAIADSDGLEAVSFRRVAAALDAGPMRLYGYLATKEELLELMAEAVYAEIEAETRGTADALRAVPRATRHAALRHEWYVDLIGGRRHLGPHALAVLETSAAAFATTLADDLDAVWLALGTVNAYVVGAVQQEIAERRVTRLSQLDEAGWQAAEGPYLVRMFAAGKFPTLARLVHDGAHVSPEDAFEQGLSSVLAGIGAGQLYVSNPSDR